MVDPHRDSQEPVITARRVPVYAQILLALWVFGIVFAYWLLNDRLVVPLVGVFGEIAVWLIRLFSYS
jgi:hypothetical protein